MREIVVSRTLLRVVFDVLIAVLIVLTVWNVVRINAQQASACRAAQSNRATLVGLIDTPHSFPGGPAAYYARQRGFYARLGFKPRQVKDIIADGKQSRAMLLSRLGPSDPC